MSEKWQNDMENPAGPRQIKDANKAMRDLRWEGMTFTEVNGVVGGDEHRSTLTSMMGPVREEVIALDDAIRAKYNGTVSRANVRQITADYQAALPEAVKSRPVHDNRRTPEEEAERNAASAARDAEWKAKQDAENAVLAQVLAKKPSGAQALIVAEYNEDRSDPMTDYFSNATTRTVAIGWRYGSREDFRQLHAAAASFAETADSTFEERRDNYSMGRGNYLSDHGWDGAGTGWVIKSRTPGPYLSLTEDAIPDTPAAPAASVSGSGVTVSPSSTGRDGVVEVRFDEKPDYEVIDGLKRHGFRWARGNRCWYGRDVAYAEALASKV